MHVPKIKQEVKESCHNQRVTCLANTVHCQMAQVYSTMHINLGILILRDKRFLIQCEHLDVQFVLD